MHPVILLLLSSITTDWVWLLIFTRFLDHTQRRTTVGRTSLNEWSFRHNTQQSQQTNNHAPRRAEDFYLPLKLRRLRPGFEPANLGTKGQHATSRPPKPLLLCVMTKVRGYSLLLTLNIWCSVSSINWKLLFILAYFCNLYNDHTFISNFTFFIFARSELCI